MSTTTIQPGSAAAAQLAGAVAVAKAGDMILLAPGTYNTAVDLNKTGLTLAQVDGTPAGSAIIQFAGAHDYSQALKVSADNVTVRDIAVKGINCRDVAVSPAKGVRLIGVHSIGDLYGFDFDSVDGLLLQLCTATRKSSYVYFAHGNQVARTGSGEITVDRCQGSGSSGQHNFRLNVVRKATFSKCDFAFAPDSANGKLAPGISVRAGCGDVVIDDCDLYGLGGGPEIWAGADAPGSTVGSITVTNSRIRGGYVALYSGLQRVLIADTTIAADRSGSAISIGDGIAGELARLTVTYPGGALFNRKLADIPASLKLTGPITHNGAVAIAGAPRTVTLAQADADLATVLAKLTDPAAIEAAKRLRAGVK